MGRFINADTTAVLYVSPMGVTDKNLFAYCDNNPVVRIDISGYGWKELWGWVVDKYERITSIHAQEQMVNNQILSEQIEMARDAVDAVEDAADSMWDAYMRGYNLQQEAQALEAQMTLDGAKRIYEYLDENEELTQGLSGGGKIAKGARDIKSGIGLILVPAPTVVDDLLGVGKIAWGIINACYGIAKVVGASVG